ncbi:tetratricopeptide repeat protein [Flavobacterium sp. AG291]|uniref:type IX secretion system periplasmic lipoprotein PorW/SprE n=1 Tax=Flavobacterium sp. AG291 TaxID=2184000 RepID=UPI000E2B386D|nr:gliding motility protein [Flavobacterium sp. AG291]RDI07946.1 protein involved in gliding motility SprE [Flavobacterium sp. AG291]
MKTSTSKYFILFGAVGLAIACSTKKDSFVNRNYHAVTTEYNVLYNGNLALDAGLKDLSTTYEDNFWDVLPIERTQPVVSVNPPSQGSSTTVGSGPGGANASGKDAKSAKDLVGGIKSGADKMVAAQNFDLGGKKNSAALSKGGAAGASGGVQGAGQQTPNFKRAEEKATKAIQKHSMNIGGSEKNPQMDEAYLLLGKSRYYENRYLPALEAFNYILLKYPSSDKIDDAKIWREKTNIRLDNEAIAIRNLKELIKQKRDKMDEQTYADANAMLAQGYLSLQENDSAVTVLKEAAAFTEKNEEKARYHFILGQLQSKLKRPDSAYTEYQRVIDMKRKSPRRYVIQAHAMQAGQFDYKNGDTLVFMEKYRKLLEDRENRPYLDIINHQVGIFYDKQNDEVRAKEYYNKSLRQNSRDRYLTASNYRNIAEINFKEAQYATAGMYYDSTMVFLDNRSREYRSIKKKRDNLADVIKYEAIAKNNDSILSVVAMDEAGRKAYYEDYISKLKAKEEAEKKKLEKEAIKQENLASGGGNFSSAGIAGMSSRGFAGQTGQAGASATGGKFYFNTASTVAYGKQEFKRKWGNRAYSENWRWSSEQTNKAAANAIDGDSIFAGVEGKLPKDGKDKAVEPRFRTDFYISQLPTDKKLLDSLATERNFAYYQLGSIYKDKFKEYRLAADKLERLLQNDPEERLVLPSKYNLYKIYQIIDPAKAEAYKQQILSQYPDSRYAEIIRNPTSDAAKNLTPDAAYDQLFKKYNEGQVREVFAQIDESIDTYTGEEIVSKFELLKAQVSARLMGIEEYKKGLNFVALNYPNSEEGKKAELLLKTDIPNLEKLAFGEPTASWKIIYKFDFADEAKIKPLKDKIEKFIKEGLNNNIKLTSDVYTIKENMLVVHGFSSKLAAEEAVSVLKDYKKYKVAEVLEVISTEDYKVVQIKKDFTEFLAIE